MGMEGGVVEHQVGAQGWWQKKKRHKTTSGNNS